jgi:Flp pilus assembly pilin Flp
MKQFKRLRRDRSGAAAIEMAFALPAMIVLIWMIVQLGLVFRAMAGIQHSLGEGARLATIWPAPDADAIRTKMENAVYGIGPGTFDIPEPEAGTADGASYLDLEVTYSQPTDLLIIPGPTIEVSRSKRVWRAESDT